MSGIQSCSLKITENCIFSHIMQPDEYRRLLKKNNVTQRMVAAHSGYSDTAVCNSLKGLDGETFKKIFSVCDEGWMERHNRPTEGGMSENDEEKIVQSKRLAEHWGKFTEKDPADPANPYQNLVRQCHSYVFHHYFGLIENVDLLADESNKHHYRVSRFISIQQGIEQNIPYWMIACPLNLRIVHESDKTSKKTLTKDKLLELFAVFIARYPRYWIVLCQNLNKIGIPNPFSPEERRLSRDFYKSVKSGKKVPHKHRRSAGTGMAITVKAKERGAFEDALDQCVAEEVESAARRRKGKGLE